MLSNEEFPTRILGEVHSLTARDAIRMEGSAGNLIIATKEASEHQPSKAVFCATSHFKCEPKYSRMFYGSWDQTGNRSAEDC